MAAACRASDAWLLYDAATDEIHFDGIEPRHPATLDDLRERTVIPGGVSKSFRVTGWRVGWAGESTAVMGDVALAAIYNTTVASGSPD